MQVFVRTVDGKNITLDVEPTDTIQNLASKILDHEGLAVDLQTLVFLGMKLEDNHTLADYNVQKEATIHLFAFPDLGGFSSTSSGYTGGSGGAAPGPAADAACFLAGTRIGTPQGEVPIETIRPGDWVFSIPYGGYLRGRPYPRLTRVRWVGRRHRPPGQALPAPAQNHPVCLRRSGLDGEVPYADLYVTGSHQVAARGTLATAASLVDGTAVLWQEPAGQADLWHLELDAFGLVLANGVPCESFLDVGNRRVFDAEFEPAAPRLG